MLRINFPVKFLPIVCQTDGSLAGHVQQYEFSSVLQFPACDACKEQRNELTQADQYL